MASSPAPRRPRSRALAVAWLASGAALGALAWLVSTVPDRTQERSAGSLLLGAAVVAVVLAGAPPATARRRELSLAGSALVLLSGAGAAALVGSAGDLLLVLGVPAACAAVTAVLALREGR